mmetsp:Transcript_78894/g.118575  ORF Transcript_78894/g.118575 Transcript_78894/m.118575 type:complete len:246 (+) Transcript_78894:128-865(+)
MKRIVPLPAWASVVVIFHDPTKSHHIRSKHVLASSVGFNVIGFALVRVISVLPTTLVQADFVIYILGVLIQFVLLRALDFILERLYVFGATICGRDLYFHVVFVLFVVFKLLLDTSDYADSGTVFIFCGGIFRLDVVELSFRSSIAVVGLVFLFHSLHVHAIGVHFFFDYFVPFIFFLDVFCRVFRFYPHQRLLQRHRSSRVFLFHVRRLNFPLSFFLERHCLRFLLFQDLGGTSPSFMLRLIIH